MPILYKDNKQIVIEIKKLMLKNKISQREIADKMNIKPQGLTKILNKKNFGIVTCFDPEDGEAYFDPEHGIIFHTIFCHSCGASWIMDIGSMNREFIK